MAIVGSAEVVVHALTEQFEADLDRSFGRAEGQADEAGNSAGSRYGSSFGRSSSREIDQAGLGLFRLLEDEAGSSGSVSGGHFSSAFGRNSRIGPELRAALDDVIRDAERTGKAAGQKLATGVTRAAEDAASELESAIGGGINNVEKNLGNIDFSGFSVGFALKIAALIPLIGVLGGGLAALVGALGAVAAAAAFAAGSLAILATAFTGLALGGITALFAFGGLGKAITAYSQATAKSGKASLTAARQQQAAASAVISAQQGVEHALQGVKDAEYALAQARKNADESAVSDAHNVASAEYTLAQAQENARQAQQDLTDARRDAINQLMDMQLSLRGAVLGEREAQLRLEQAQQAYQDTVSDPTATEQQRRQALLDLQQAQLSLDQAKQSRKEQTQQVEEANRKGVSGSDQVVSAKEREQDAVHSVAEATYALQQAQQRQADDAAANAHAIQQAQLGVKNALEQVANAQRALAQAQQRSADTANAAQTALDGLSPKAQEFVKFIVGLKPELDKLRAAAGARLFGPLTDSLKSLVANFLPALRVALRETGEGLAGFFDQIVEALTSPQITEGIKTLAAKFNEIVPGTGGLTAWQTFGHIIGNIIKGIVGLAEAAFPTFQRFIGWLNRITGQFATAFDGSGLIDATKLINRMGDAAAHFGDLFGAIFKLAGAFIGDATKAGLGFVDSMTKSINKTAEFISIGGEGRPGLLKFFEDIKPVVGSVMRFIGQLAKQFFKLGQNKSLAGIFDSMTEALPDLEKGIENFTNNVAPPMISAIKTIITVFKNFAGSPTFKIISKTIGVIIDIFGKLATTLTSGPLGQVAVPLLTVLAGRFVYFVAKAKLVKIAEKALDALRLTLGPLSGVLTKFGKGIIYVGKAFRYAFITNPWVGGILAVGIAFYEAYKHSETFRKIVQAVIHKVGDAFSFLWNSVIKPVFGAIKGAFDFFADHWKTVVSVFLGIIAGPFGAAIALIITHFGTFKKIVGEVFGFFRQIATTVFRAVIRGASALWEGIKKSFSAIGRIIKTIITTVIKLYLIPLQAGFKLVKTVALALWHNGIQPAWDGIKKAISVAWNDVIKPTLNLIKGLLHDVGGAATWLWEKAIKPAWQKINSFTKSIWDKFTGWIKSGISTAIEIINKFLGIFKTVLGFVHIDVDWHVTNPFPEASLLAGGGTVGPGFKTDGPRAIVGEGDPRYPEYVIPTDPRHRSNALNLFKSLGGELMEKGGKLGHKKQRPSGKQDQATINDELLGSFLASSVGGEVDVKAGGLKGAIGSVVDFGRSILAKGVLATLKAMEVVPRGLISTIPVPFVRDFMNGGIDKANEGVEAMIRGSQVAQDARTGGTTAPGGARPIWNLLRAAGFPPIQAAGILGNMAYEDGNFDPWRIQGGGRSPNPAAAGSGGYGLVQWTPGSKLIPYLHGQVPTIGNEIAALAAQLAGRGPSPEGTAGASLRAAISPFDAAYRFGGKTTTGGYTVPQGYERYDGPFQVKRAQAANQYYAQFAGKFDSGGLLPPGLSTVLNNSGQPEPVLTGTQWSNLVSVMSRDAANTSQVVEELRLIKNSLEALRNVERFQIENFHANAAANERAETAVPRGLRKLMFELGD